MKKLIICSSLLLIGAGCSPSPIPVEQNEPVIEEENIETPAIKEKDADEPEVATEQPTFVPEDFLPDPNLEYELRELDFEDDGINEYAIMYTVENVDTGKDYYEYWTDTTYSDIRKITYMKVYKRIDGAWAAIKEDLVNQSGAAVDQSYSHFEVVQLGESDRDHLWVGKRENKSQGKYYIFGLQEDGAYDDWAIPKGYLNYEQYLGEGDRFIDGTASAVSREGITEKYDVFCDDREAFGAGGRPCRGFELFVPFEREINSFGIPKMQNVEQYE